MVPFSKGKYKRQHENTLPVLEYRCRKFLWVDIQTRTKIIKHMFKSYTIQDQSIVLDELHSVNIKTRRLLNFPIIYHIEI